MFNYTFFLWHLHFLILTLEKEIFIWYNIIYGLVIRSRSTTAGETPRHFLFKGNILEELSIFIDESGDFGKYKEYCPYYIVSLIFHEQKYSINDHVNRLNLSLEQMGLKNHTIHTGPLIRKEKSYSDGTLQLRYNIFLSLVSWTRLSSYLFTSYKHLVLGKTSYFQ